MRAFFDSSPVTSRGMEDINKKIINLLNRNGCTVVQTVMGTELAYLDQHSGRAASNIYTARLNEVRHADVFICELSTVSVTLVFEIFEALAQRKPVLALIGGENQEALDAALLGHPSNLLSVEVYNEDNLEGKIEQFIKKAHGKVPVSRFTVRLTREMGNYVNFLKAKMGCPSKNEVIIKILEQMVREETEFTGGSSTN